MSIHDLGAFGSDCTRLRGAPDLRALIGGLGYGLGRKGAANRRVHT